jgi:hypothetical protein
LKVAPVTDRVVQQLSLPEPQLVIPGPPGAQLCIATMPLSPPLEDPDPLPLPELASDPELLPLPELPSDPELLPLPELPSGREPLPVLDDEPLPLLEPVDPSSPTTFGSSIPRSDAQPPAPANAANSAALVASSEAAVPRSGFRSGTARPRIHPTTPAAGAP